jgi:hypothetical protein
MVTTAVLIVGWWIAINLLGLGLLVAAYFVVGAPRRAPSSNPSMGRQTAGACGSSSLSSS